MSRSLSRSIPPRSRLQNLSLTLNGGANLINSGVTITQDSPTTFTIGGLSAITGDDGNYTLTVDATGISDFFGDVGTASGSASTSWATGTNVPVVVSVGAGNPALSEHARRFGRRRPLRADRPGVVQLPGAQLDPERRVQPHHLGRHGHRDHADDLQHRRPRLPDHRRRQLRPDGERRRTGRRLGQLGRRLPFGNLDDEHGRPDRSRRCRLISNPRATSSSRRSM